MATMSAASRTANSASPGRSKRLTPLAHSAVRRLTKCRPCAALSAMGPASSSGVRSVSRSIAMAYCVAPVQPLLVLSKSGMKLSEKFARQESEDARLARIGRRRISKAQSQAVRRFLGDHQPKKSVRAARVAVSDGPLQCDECGRRFTLPMHLGRHRKSAHDHPSVIESGGVIESSDVIESAEVSANGDASNGS